jgi:hypothetical protein
MFKCNDMNGYSSQYDSKRKASNVTNECRKISVKGAEVKEWILETHSVRKRR